VLPLIILERGFSPVLPSRILSQKDKKNLVRLFVLACRENPSVSLFVILWIEPLFLLADCNQSEIKPADAPYTAATFSKGKSTKLEGRGEKMRQKGYLSQSNQDFDLRPFYLVLFDETKVR
jgi:hypothetical protein